MFTGKRLSNVLMASLSVAVAVLMLACPAPDDGMDSTYYYYGDSGTKLKWVSANFINDNIYEEEKSTGGANGTAKYIEYYSADEEKTTWHTLPDAVDFSRYTHLVFWGKQIGIRAIDIELGCKSGDKEVGLKRTIDSKEWKEYKIPLTELTDADKDFDLTKVQMPSYLITTGGDYSDYSDRIGIDEIYLSKE